jgi:hypothetical protein
MIALGTERARAIGLVHVAVGAHSPDRWWARALVVRHARDHHLQLVDVLELDEDQHRNASELLRLAELVVQTDVTTLVTYGVDLELANRFAADLGVRPVPAPPGSRRDEA